MIVKIFGGPLDGVIEINTLDWSGIDYVFFHDAVYEVGVFGETVILTLTKKKEINAGNVRFFK